MPTTQMIPVTLASIGEIDGGRLEKTLQWHFQELSSDCISRPGEKAERKLTIEIGIKPVIDPDTGDCVDTNQEYRFKSTIPPHRSKPYTMRVSNRGFLVNRDFPDQPDQASLYSEETDG